MSEDIKEKSIIYIFQGKKSKKNCGTLSLREIFKENSITDIILIDLNMFSKKISDSLERENQFKSEILIEELIVIDMNLYIRPIIFYGLDEDTYYSIVCELGLEDCSCIGWIKDPFKMDNLREIISIINAGGFDPEVQVE